MCIKRVFLVFTSAFFLYLSHMYIQYLEHQIHSIKQNMVVIVYSFQSCVIVIL